MTTVPISSTDQPSSFLARLWTPRNRYYFIAFLFILPAVINFSIFRYLPIFAAARASLWQYSLLGGYRDFIGLQHYQFMMEDIYFWKSMKVTALFVLMKVPLQVLLSLMFAVLLQKETRSSAIVRSAIFTPVVTSVVVVSIIWAMMYHSQLGLINSILSAFGIPRQVFLSDADRALPAMSAMMVWKDLGFSMIIIMAGLKGIPVVYREAAIVDGAKPWQIMRHITLPLLKRVLMFVVVTQTIFSFQNFVPVYVMTKGGPMDSTKVIVFYIYQYGFLFQDMGYASAMSVVTLLVLLVVSMIQMRLFRTDVEY